MIVTKSVEGIHIIFHEAHGILAGKIANEIHVKFRPEHWFDTLIAVCEHDDRQLDFNEKEYLSEIGVPLDFTEQKSKVNDALKRMKRVLESAEKKSLWIKLLISYHLEFINSQLAEKSKLISTFLAEQAAERRENLKLFNIPDSKARKYYEFLRFCDRLSLILCKDEAPDAERLLEINTSIDGKTYFIKKNKKDELIISPWIFTDSSFELSVEQRILKAGQFASPHEFKATLLKTKPVLKRWILIKAGN